MGLLFLLSFQGYNILPSSPQHRHQNHSTDDSRANQEHGRGEEAECTADPTRHVARCRCHTPASTAERTEERREDAFYTFGHARHCAADPSGDAAEGTTEGATETWERTK